MVAPSFRPPQRLPARPLRLVAFVMLAALLAFALPTFAEHPQTVQSGTGSFSAQFDHDGDSEWWVEFQARPLDGGSIFNAFARVEGTSTWHYMKFAANDWERQQQGWSKFAPDRAFQVPPGKRVQFQVHMTDDGTQDTGIVESCWFTHPAGAEQCGTSSSSTTTSGGTFDAPFTGFRGNEWWVQAKVGTSGPSIAKVDVRIAPDGVWKPLTKQSWNTAPASWAGSYHFPQGSVLQMRATATDGRTDLSSCRQWIPPSGQDATVVPCPGTQPTGFDATWSNVKGNEWWVQANVKGNQPLAGVAVRVDCAPQWRPMTLQSWGGWTASFRIPPGSKVDFQARSTTGEVDASGGYTWPSATATSGCALGAWPEEGSSVTYRLNGGVCGGGECFDGSASLTLTYGRDHRWTGVCMGTDRHSRTDGSVVIGHYTTRLDTPPLFERANTQAGTQHQVQELTVFYGRPCGVDDGVVHTVVGQADEETSLRDASGNTVTVRAWRAERNNEADGENFYVAHWDTDLGMVLDHASHPRRSQQGSWSTQLWDTDAPVR